MNFSRWRNRPVLSFALPVLGAFVVMVGVLYLCIHPEIVLAKLNEWKLIPHEEPVTELYLNNYLNFPKQIAPGQKVSFSFTIHNLEGKEMTYPYVIYLQTFNSTRLPIARSTTTLADNESKVVSESYTFTGSSPQATFFIELPTVGETLHFTLPTRIQP